MPWVWCASHAPFAALKQSGLGKEGGRLGLEEFLETTPVSAAPEGS
jgi:acyl-CoA reductase-like NAD-dependent aldehyde dehydrogenase